MSDHSSDELERMAAAYNRKREADERAIKADGWQKPSDVLQEALDDLGLKIPQHIIDAAVEIDSDPDCYVCARIVQIDEAAENMALCDQHREAARHQIATTILRQHFDDDQLHALQTNVHTPLRNWTIDDGSVYAYGPTGTGKTHDITALCKQAWIQWRDRFGKPPSFRWIKVPEFIEDVLDSFGTNEKVDISWRDADVLVLDDIGMGDEKPFAVRKLYTALERRSNRRRRQITFITSNLNLDDLGIHLKDDRIPSRIDGMCSQVSYEGLPDRRSQQAPRLRPND